VPAGQTAGTHLRALAAESLAARLPGLLPEAPGHTAEDYHARLERELDVICNMGFPGYFLIVADFIRWAKENDIPVGPGRGSGAGSLVAFVLGITDLDPLRYELLFERFLNPERVSMPDFDIDFCINGRDRVIDYVARRYGRDSVAQIITYGSMAAKAVVRDVGRVLGHPYGFTDRIAKLIPFEVGMTLDKALVQEPELKPPARDRGRGSRPDRTRQVAGRSGAQCRATRRRRRDRAHGADGLHAAVLRRRRRGTGYPVRQG
jgi:DNA polymerase III subunit alpha